MFSQRNNPYCVYLSNCAAKILLFFQSCTFLCNVEGGMLKLFQFPTLSLISYGRCWDNRRRKIKKLFQGFAEGIFRECIFCSVTETRYLPRIIFE